MTNKRVARGERDDDMRSAEERKNAGGDAASEAIDSRYRRLATPWTAVEEAGRDEGLVGYASDLTN